MIIEIALGVFLGMVLFAALPTIFAGMLFLMAVGVAVALFAGAMALIYYFPQQIALAVVWVVILSVGLLVLARFQLWRSARPQLVIPSIDEVATIAALYLLTSFAASIFLFAATKAIESLGSVKVVATESVITMAICGGILVLLIWGSVVATKAILLRARERAKLRTLLS